MSEHPEATTERWKPPYVPWFESDFQGSQAVRKMPPLARLMYRALLMAAWQTDNPPYLPTADDDLAFLADAPSPAEWHNHREAILRQFTTTPDGRLYHSKSLREYERINRQHQVLSDAAHKGNQTRWHRQATATPSPPARIQNQKQNQNQEDQKHLLNADALSVCAPASQKPKTPKPARSRGVSPGFDRFWDAYSRKTAKGAALKAWPKAVTYVETEKKLETPQAVEFLVEAAKEFSTAMRGTEQRYIPHPATWLNQARYFDDRGCWRPAPSASAPVEDYDHTFAAKLSVERNRHREGNSRRHDAI